MEKLLKKLSITCDFKRNLFYYLIPSSLKTVYCAYFLSSLQF